jgi:hypothetical protein
MMEQGTRGTARGIVEAARLLLSQRPNPDWRTQVKYRYWQPGNAIPMWLDDGIQGIPSAGYLAQHGVMGADLVNFALVMNGLQPNGGTGSFADYLVNTSPFDPSPPGQMGAIALRPYQGPGDDGSIALYLGEHQVIQSIPSEGVTARYTDKQTYSWASQGYPRYGFTIYGFLWGVSY